MAVAVLELGRFLHEQERKHGKDRDPSRLRQAEEDLIGLLQAHRSPSLRQAFDFDAGKPVDPLLVRVLAYVAYVSLCSTRLGVAVCETQDKAALWPQDPVSLRKDFCDDLAIPVRRTATSH